MPIALTLGTPYCRCTRSTRARLVLAAITCSRKAQPLQWLLAGRQRGHGRVVCGYKGLAGRTVITVVVICCIEFAAHERARTLLGLVNKNSASGFCSLLLPVAPALSYAHEVRAASPGCACGLPLEAMSAGCRNREVRGWPCVHAPGRHRLETRTRHRTAGPQHRHGAFHHDSTQLSTSLQVLGTYRTQFVRSRAACGVTHQAATYKRKIPNGVDTATNSSMTGLSEPRDASAALSVCARLEPRHT